MSKPLEPLGPGFIEAMKGRININEQFKRYAKLMQQNYLAARGEIKLTKSQQESAKIFMIGLKVGAAKCIPDLKAVEHSGDIGKRELTREELIERLTQLHGRAAAGTEQRSAAGNGAAVGDTEVHH